MEAEFFKIAKEISGLSALKEELEQQIIEQENRITSLIKRRDDRENVLERSTQKLKKYNHELMEIENNISKYQDQLNKDNDYLKSITSNEQLKSVEHSIEYCKSHLDELEEQGLELLEKSELLNTEIGDCKTFLNGLEESLEEVKAEVDQFRLENKEKINGLNSRVESLLQELPDDFQGKVIRTLDKKIKQSSFTRIRNEACEFCRLTLSKTDVSNIEDKLMVKSCVGCERMFLPEISTR